MCPWSASYVPDNFGMYREAWTLVSALTACTERVRVGTLVLGVTHRHVPLVGELRARPSGVVGGGVDPGERPDRLHRAGSRGNAGPGRDAQACALGRRDG